MKIHWNKMAALLAAGGLLLGSASAVSFSGTVGAARSYEIYAPIGGTVERVTASVGETVVAGDVLATLESTKVYAEENGVVTGIFGAAGDSAETVTERYGAVMYIEGATLYSIAASTDEAYNTTQNKLVHVGEEVYLYCYSHGTHTGRGVITAIEGTDYTVKVTDGEFLLGETVSIFRGDSATSSERIGRGDAQRENPTAVTGSGGIVSIAVENGAAVKKGDLLFETLEGEFDGRYVVGAQISADTAGVIAEIKLNQGERIEKGGVAAVLYPEGAMRVEAQVSEYDLCEIAVGDPVKVELSWNQDADVSYEGVISMISAIANEGGEGGDATYTVYVDFTPDADTRYGMSTVVSTMDEFEDENADETV